MELKPVEIVMIIAISLVSVMIILNAILALFGS